MTGEAPATADAAPRLENARGQRQRLAWLDTLRFVAIVGVLLVHVGYAFPAIGRTAVLLLGVGRYGVDLFFAISGFLFAELMLGRSTGSLHYLARRTLRITAVYYTAMVLYAWLRSRPVAGTELLINVSFLNPWFTPAEEYLVPGGWSICAEMFFYVAGVLAMPLLSSRRHVLACWAATFLLAVIIHLVAGGTLLAHDHSPLMNLPTFVGGVACWWFRGAAPSGRVASTLLAVCFVALAVLSLQVLPGVPRCVAGVGCVVAAWSFSRTRPFAWSAWLGRLSYSAYAFHFALLEWTIVLVVAALALDATPWVAPVMTFAVLLPSTLGVAFLVHRYLETPVSRVLRRAPLSRVRD